MTAVDDSQAKHHHHYHHHHHHRRIIAALAAFFVFWTLVLPASWVPGGAWALTVPHWVVRCISVCGGDLKRQGFCFCLSALAAYCLLLHPSLKEPITGTKPTPGC